MEELYKSRNENAIEYIRKNVLIANSELELNIDFNEFSKKLLEILEG